jgi:hypothetical protein
MGQVYFANGKLWSALGTGITFDGVTYGSAGLAYFVLHPKAGGGTPVATVDNQGYLADPNLDVIWGTVAVTQSGRGVLSFTATGPANYPSVGFASLDALAGGGDIQIAAAGVGAQDGFTGYRAEGFGPGETMGPPQSTATRSGLDRSTSDRLVICRNTSPPRHSEPAEAPAAPWGIGEHVSSRSHHSGTSPVYQRA